MDKNNIGFRQYRLPINIDIILNHSEKIKNQGFIIDEQYPINNIVDGDINTYCKLTGDINKRLIFNFVSSEETSIFCSSIKLVFNNPMKRVRIIDNQGQDLYDKIDNKGFFTMEKEINKNLQFFYIRFAPKNNNQEIQLSSVEVYDNTLINTIEPPEGYYIKDFEIQSEKAKGGEDNGD